jgi:hypothetical protein
VQGQPELFLGVNEIKRIAIASIAYVTTGIGCYYTVVGDGTAYGFIILFIGLIGVMFDVLFHKRTIE